MPALDGDTELIQVDEAKDTLPTSIDSMKSMIDAAMKSTEAKDLGEMNDAKEQTADLQKTMDYISEQDAIEEEMEVEAKKDCKLSKWNAWTSCSAKCGGGLKERKRKILETAVNGGTPCPLNDDGTPFVHEKSSCNTESCAEEAAQHEAKLRHLTDAEIEKESAMNNQVLKLAMNSRSIKQMKRELHHWMKKSVKTSMVHVLLPGEAPPTEEELVQKDLKAAIAKNSINSAMAGFRQEEADKSLVKPNEAHNPEPQSTPAANKAGKA
eukprot:TRINITY_DN3209_c0_g1_i6.p1 TRINITY_DN3209_c0_g1~~TRINITY_DN3209_c0_g1_i6.p1  ORF type:complete len:267 (+),score=101.28 TRINITY_DN3209_c0_g1_i6:232-1032(+)